VLLLSRVRLSRNRRTTAGVLSRRKTLEDLLGDLRESADEHLAVRLPPFVEDGVPGTHSFLVRDGHLTSGWAVGWLTPRWQSDRHLTYL
jgi:hypothetical protein